VHNAKRFYPLVREAAEKHDIEKLYADKAYDNRRILTAIEIRKTESTSSGGCQLRREEIALLIKKLGSEGWKRVKDAGSRSWIAETVFSSIKGLLGEDPLSTKFSTQKVEAR
jgi:hypothetical protein